MDTRSPQRPSRPYALAWRREHHPAVLAPVDTCAPPEEGRTPSSDALGTAPGGGVRRQAADAPCVRAIESQHAARVVLSVLSTSAYGRVGCRHSSLPGHGLARGACAPRRKWRATVSSLVSIVVSTLAAVCELFVSHVRTRRSGSTAYVEMYQMRTCSTQISSQRNV